MTENLSLIDKEFPEYERSSSPSFSLAATLTLMEKARADERKEEAMRYALQYEKAKKEGIEQGRKELEKDYVLIDHLALQQFDKTGTHPSRDYLISQLKQWENKGIEQGRKEAFECSRDCDWECHKEFEHGWESGKQEGRREVLDEIERKFVDDGFNELEMEGYYIKKKDFDKLKKQVGGE